MWYSIICLCLDILTHWLGRKHFCPSRWETHPETVDLLHIELGFRGEKNTFPANPAGATRLVRRQGKSKHGTPNSWVNRMRVLGCRFQDHEQSIAGIFVVGRVYICPPQFLATYQGTPCPPPRLPQAWRCSQQTSGHDWRALQIWRVS